MNITISSSLEYNKTNLTVGICNRKTTPSFKSENEDNSNVSGRRPRRQNPLDRDMKNMTQNPTKWDYGDKDLPLGCCSSIAGVLIAASALSLLAARTSPSTSKDIAQELGSKEVSDNPKAINTIQIFEPGDTLGNETYNPDESESQLYINEKLVPMSEFLRVQQEIIGKREVF